MASRNEQMRARLSGGSTTARLELQCLDDSTRWFGDTLSEHDIVHHVLALCGEAGELANLVKKVQRGSLDIHDPVVRRELAMELTDTYIYALNVAGILGVDLEKSYMVKRSENEKRFMEERMKREAKRA